MTMPVPKNPNQWDLQDFLLLLTLDDLDPVAASLSQSQIQAAVARLKELLDAQPNFKEGTFVYPNTEFNEEVQIKLADQRFYSLPIFEQLAFLQAALSNL